MEQLNETETKLFCVHGGLSNIYFECSTSHTLGGSTASGGGRGGELGAIESFVGALSGDERSGWEIGLRRRGSWNSWFERQTWAGHQIFIY